MNVEIKLEHNKAKATARTPLGLMVELTAPSVTVRPDQVRVAKSVVFVIDNSGSMAGPRLDIVKRAVLEQLPKFKTGDRLAIVTFDNHAHVHLGLTNFHETELDFYRHVVNGIIDGGNTNLEAGYRLGLKEALTRVEGTDGETTIILLSDGEANNGETNPAVLGRIASDAFEQGVTTSTIGIGDGYDERILVALADKGRGSHVAAYRVEQAATAIRDEIDDLNSRTMLNTRVEVTILDEFANNDARLRCLTKLREWNRAGCFGFGSVGDLPAEHKQNIAFELKLSRAGARFAGSRKQAVRVRVSYTDGNTGAEVVVERVFEVDVVDDLAWTDPVRDPDVVAEIRDLKLQQTKERIYELLNEGRGREARFLLERLNLDMEELMHLGLSPRNFDRMAMQVNSMMASAAMDDGHLSKFLLASKLEREYDRKRRN